MGRKGKPRRRRNLRNPRPTCIKFGWEGISKSSLSSRVCIHTGNFSLPRVFESAANLGEISDKITTMGGGTPLSAKLPQESTPQRGGSREGFRGGVIVRVLHEPRPLQPTSSLLSEGICVKDYVLAHTIEREREIPMSFLSQGRNSWIEYTYIQGQEDSKLNVAPVENPAA